MWKTAWVKMADRQSAIRLTPRRPTQRKPRADKIVNKSQTCIAPKLSEPLDNPHLKKGRCMRHCTYPTKIGVSFVSREGPVISRTSEPGGYALALPPVGRRSWQMRKVIRRRR